MREQSVRDGRQVGLGEEAVVAHALQEYFFVQGTQVVPQALVAGEMSGYTCQTAVLKSFNHCHSS